MYVPPLLAPGALLTTCGWCVSGLFEARVEAARATVSCLHLMSDANPRIVQEQESAP